MARRRDDEIEKIANFVCLERPIISRERLRAMSYAVIMHVMRKLLETSWPTAAAAERLFTLDKCKKNLNSLKLGVRTTW